MATGGRWVCTNDEPFTDLGDSQSRSASVWVETFVIASSPRPMD